MKNLYPLAFCNSTEEWRDHFNLDLYDRQMTNVDG